MSDRKDTDMERSGHRGAQAGRINSKDEGHGSSRGGMCSVIIGKSPEWSRGTSEGAEWDGDEAQDRCRIVLG